MSSYATVYLVDVSSLPSFDVLQALILKGCTYSEDYFKYYPWLEKTGPEALRALVTAVTNASDLESLAQGLQEPETLVCVRGNWYLRSSRWANDNILDLQADVLEKAFRGHLIPITRVHY